MKLKKVDLFERLMGALWGLGTTIFTRRLLQALYSPEYNTSGLAVKVLALFCAALGVVSSLLTIIKVAVQTAVGEMIEEKDEDKKEEEKI
jgi:hypothetical protein